MPTLIVSDPAGKQSRFELEPARRYTLGRSEANDVALADTALSRKHARLMFAGGRWKIEDCGSSNGTYVNGQRIAAAVPIGPHDRVQLGESELSLEDEAVTSGRVTMSDDRPTGQGTLKLSSDSVRMDPEATMIGKDPAAVRDELDSIRRRYAVVERANLELLAHETPEALLPRILDLVFEAVRPDRAALLIIGADGELVCRAQKGVDEGEMAISRTIANTVVAERASVLTLDATSDQRFSAGESIVLQKIRGAMAVPLWHDRRVTGLIYVDSMQVGHRFKEDDLRLLTMLGNVAAIQLENAALFREQLDMRRLEEEARVAAEIQQGLLPSGPPQIDGYAFVGHNEPCFEVGGDYFDCRRVQDGRHMVTIGDVAGKGMGPALLMAGLHATLEARAETTPLLVDLLGKLNDAVARMAPNNRFITLFVAKLDQRTHRLRCINAGHGPPPRIVRADGTVRNIPSSGPPLGVMPDWEYAVEELELAPGDALVACSDGVTEAEDSEGRMFGETGLSEFLSRSAGLEPAAVRDALRRELQAHVGTTPQRDDLTVIVLQRRP